MVEQAAAGAAAGKAGESSAGNASDWMSSPWMVGGLTLLDWFGNSKMENPYDASSGYLSKLGSQSLPYYQSYMNAGNVALPMLMGEYSQNMMNPSATYNKLASGFEQSPGYQYQYQQNMNAANSAAAAGGMAGSPAAQQNAATMSQGMASQDYGNYMDYMGKLYGGGLSGMSNINQMGYNANTGYAGILNQQAMAEAYNAMLAQQWENENSSSSGIFGLF